MRSYRRGGYQRAISTTTTTTTTARRATPHGMTRRKGPFRRRWQSTNNNNVAAAAAAAAAEEVVPEPSYAILRDVAFAQAIPFIGFGFMDNAILIIAGDAIDTSLGIWLGISTLCAAAIGNIISDLAGIGMGTVIEDFCANVLKLAPPNVTTAQRQLRSVRRASNLGMAVGMTIGCVIGMFPLLLIDTGKNERLKKKAHLECLFKDVVTEAKTLIGAESTCLYLRVHLEDRDQPPNSPQRQGVNTGKSGNFLYSASVDQPMRPAVDGDHLYAMYYVIPGTTNAVEALPQPPHEPSASTNNPSVSSGSTSTSTTSGSGSEPEAPSTWPNPLSSPRFLPIGKGIVSRAILTGDAWNIPNVRLEPDYLPDLYEHDGSIPTHLHHMLVVPVLDGQGRSIAVIRALNKMPPTTSSSSSSSSPGADVAAAMTASGGFTDADVQILKSLASHISVSLQSVFRDQKDEEMRLRDTIRILKEHGIEGISADRNRLDASSPLFPPSFGGARRRPSLFPSEATAAAMAAVAASNKDQ